MAEKALKFAKKADMGWDDVAVDRSNMLLFPTIASCTSSDSEEVDGDELSRSGDELSRATELSKTTESSKTAESSKTTHSSQTRINPSRDDTPNHNDQETTSPPKEPRHHHHHHRHHHRKPFPVSYQTQHSISLYQPHHSTEAYVTISPPSSVTIMVCSNWAQRLWSLVATVQPSSHTNVSPLPSTSIGSMVNT